MKAQRSSAPSSCASFSVIIPLGPAETLNVQLLSELKTTGALEFVFVCPPGKAAVHQDKIAAAKDSRFRLIEAPCGRANQQNAGATAAKGAMLWFVHADSSAIKPAFEGLRRRAAAKSAGLWFFDLRFARPCSSLMLLNEIGVWWRSHLLRMPFGDQALACSRVAFERLGGFDASLPYGEDHILVWRAHRLNISTRWAGEVIYTSARKYETSWAKTTRRHLWMTLAQAWPQFLLWLRGQ